MHHACRCFLDPCESIMMTDAGASERDNADPLYLHDAALYGLTEIFWLFSVATCLTMKRRHSTAVSGGTWVADSVTTQRAAGSQRSRHLCGMQFQTGDGREDSGAEESWRGEHS